MLIPMMANLTRGAGANPQQLVDYLDRQVGKLLRVDMPDRPPGDNGIVQEMRDRQNETLQQIALNREAVGELWDRTILSNATYYADQGDFGAVRTLISNISSDYYRGNALSQCLARVTAQEQIETVKEMLHDTMMHAVNPELTRLVKFAEVRLAGNLTERRGIALECARTIRDKSEKGIRNHKHRFIQETYKMLTETNEAEGLSFARESLEILRGIDPGTSTVDLFSEALIGAGDVREAQVAYERVHRLFGDADKAPYALEHLWRIASLLRNNAE